MIIIKQGQTNQIVVTLTEKKVTSTSIYLFEFVNQTSSDKFYCVSPDVSTSKNRYNEFCIEEMTDASGTTNPYDSEILLALSGFYYYNVYENPSSLLSPSGLNQVETGKCLVLANKTITAPVYQSTKNPNLIVFNNENFIR